MGQMHNEDRNPLSARIGPAPAAREQFARMAREHHADLMRAARRFCMGNQDWASDLVQETLVRAYEAFLTGKYQPEASARPWLLRILTNLFINEYRRKSKWEASISPESLEFALERPARSDAASDDIPGVRLMSVLLDEEIERALAKLSDPLRVVVILVDIEGLQYDEAATTLGVPVGTIRSRLARARMQLEDYLAEYARERGIIR
jgi:RNA polymerase sigma-70 factor (ECF subfamily)